MKYLLDTNIISDRTKPAPEARCADWLAAHQHDCGLSTVTLAELRYGVERLPEGKRKRALSKKLDFLLQDYHEDVVPFDEGAAAEWGRYVANLEQKFGPGILDQIDYPDTQIAAIARANNLTVVTNNEKDFPDVATLNPSLPT
jgi:predicted nucleic acid-binding protein